MKKKTVMKVSISGDKSKTDIMKAVAKLKGVSNITLDAAGQKLTVIGEVSPCQIVKKVKKTDKKMSVDIVTVQTAPYQSYDFNRQNQEYQYRHTTNNNNNNNETTSYNTYPTSYNNYPTSYNNYHDCTPFNNRPLLQPGACYQEQPQFMYHDAPGECSIL